MRSKIITKLKKEGLRSFLSLKPLERVLSMERLLYEVITIRAAGEGVTEGEIYNRYIGRDKKRRRAV